MYFGTGWSLVLFSFPVADQLNPGNYYLQFVPQVETATHFFTYMTLAMFASCLIWIWHEWKTKFRWIPILVCIAIIAPTLLTTQFILPLNKLMKAGITDPQQLKDILTQWISYNRIRVSLWTVQWVAMMIYFTRRILELDRLRSSEAK
jgi:hypothetical protein